MGEVDREQNSTSVAAIIPAKLTSTRIPRKNLVDLGGYPLVYYSIRAAKLTKNIDAVFVSSENEKVLNLIETYGAYAIKRPAELSKPTIPNERVIFHALEIIQNQFSQLPKLIVLLQPTHPFRRPQHIEQGIKKMKMTPDADCLFTVVRARELRGRIARGRFIPEFPIPRDRSKEPKMYRNTGSFYIFRTERALSTGRVFGKSILPFEMKKPEFEVDIDDYHDLEIARCILQLHWKEFVAMGYLRGAGK